ncbi:aldose epimerase family protein [Wukongibacter baidiensis]|uniref:aldose epimerase family protein n=1 Tax=Wukongibacter baidiensis TaxID=1723361 RepID=UPI003D7F4A76
MKIVKEGFGTLKSGEEVNKYRLKNDMGLEVNVLNYGGIITEILAPDKTGKFENVVLGFDNIRDYKEKSPYFGSVVGRIAGRISGASFEIDGEEYNLAKNNGRNNLHGGEKGFDKVIWEVKEIIREDYIGIELSYFSPDGEEGFPGNLDVKMEYLLNNDNEFEIKYSAVSDKKTIINLTNHSYFNLSGDCKEDVLDHKLTINADRIGYVNHEVIPNGTIVAVEGTVFDFTEAKKVGKDINQDDQQLLYCGGYDHPFILNEDENPAAKLEDEESGRVLEIITDQPAVVFYSGNGLGEDLILSGNRKGKKNLALCLETQDYPDAINQENFPTKIYNPGEKYEAYTKYRFRLLTKSTR